MADQPFLNGWTFSRSDDTSPASFSAIPKVKDFSGLGVTNPLVDVTNFDSSAREYIAGLADGDEITIDCLYLPGNTVQEAIRTDVTNKTNFLMQVAVTDGTNTETYSFTATPLSWGVSPSYEDANMRAFTVKISGAIAVVSS